jgi:Flp pilus assembly protein TadG
MDDTRAPGGLRRDAAQHRGNGDRGAALVEFAIVLPLLMMLILGMFSGGLAYNRKLDMTHAAREGARYAATIPTSQTWSGGGDWQSNIAGYVVEKSAGTLKVSDVCVALVQGATPTVVGSFSTGGGPCFTDDPYPSYDAVKDPGRRVQIYVSRASHIDLGVRAPVMLTLASRGVT